MRRSEERKYVGDKFRTESWVDSGRRGREREREMW